MDENNVIIGVSMDVSAAERELRRLQKTISDLEAQINKQSTARSPIAAQAEATMADLQRAEQKYAEMMNAPAGTYSSAQLAKQQETINGLANRWEELHKQVLAYDNKIADANGKLTQAKTRAAELTAQLNNPAAQTTADAAKRTATETGRAADNTRNLSDNAKKSANAFQKLERRIIGLAKRVFIFSMLTRAFRAMRKALGEVINKNDEARSAFANLKSTLAQVATPIINSILPAFAKFLNALTYIIRAIASLWGQTEWAAASLNDEEDALNGVGGAAKKAGKQLAAFDEINQLSGDSGGGGGSSSANELAEILAFDPSKLSDAFKAVVDEFVITFKDIFFDWGANATAEDIVQKAITGLGMFIGGSLGFLIGGPVGAVKGVLIGALLSIFFNELLFDHDGKVSKAELTKLIISAIGGLIGMVAGITILKSFKGALIGFSIGAGVTALITSLLFKSDKNFSKKQTEDALMDAINAGLIGAAIGVMVGGVSGALIGFGIAASINLLIHGISAQKAENAYLATELGQQLRALVDESMENLEIAKDLHVKITNITGEVDESTMADFALAQQLIDDIFTLDGKENKTAEEIDIIKSKIDLLNSIGLDGLQGAFQLTTDGYILPAREEIQGLMDDILKQYQLEALHSSIVEQYENQYTAVSNLSTATDDLTESEERLTEAQSAYDEAYQKQQEAKAAWREAIQNDVADTTEYSEALSAANTELNNATKALEDAQTIYSNNKQEVEEYYAAVETATEKLAEWTVALEALATDGEAGGKAMVESTKQSIIENTPNLVTAMTDAANALGTTFDTANEISNDSSALWEKKGDAIIKGVDAGIMGGGEKLSLTMEEVSELMKKAFEEENDINSPSKVYEDEGGYLMEGLASGITNNGYRAIDAMKAVMNDLIYWAERGINSIVAKFNGVAESVNSSADGTPLQLLDRVNIPRLAQGAVIPPNREFLAVLGDQNSGTNIETPLATMVQAFKQAFAEMGGGQEAVMVVDGEVFGKLAYRLGGKESKRVGVSLTGV